MAYQYEYIDGRRVEKNVAAAFKKVKADFDRECAPITLHIADGTRTHDEQEDLFLDNYREQATGNGPFGDVRWYQGRRYVRVSGGGTIAAPPNSNHEEDGPNGPRSIDVRDSGKDAGVTRLGTKRNAIAHRLFIKYGFENEGDTFAHGPGYDLREAWHKTFRGKIGVYPVPAPAGHVVAPVFPLKKGYYFGPANPIWNLKSVSGYFSHNADLKRWQTQAKAKGFYKGAIDGKYGQKCAAAAYAIQVKNKLTRDKLVGPNTWKYAWIGPHA